MKIIVGLGNPEKKYLRTRHNLGFMVVDHLAQQLEMECNQKKFQSLFCKKAIKEDGEIILLKPQAFMNLSGIAVKEVVDMYKCALQDIMVVCDDLDLPLGKMRIRRNGGCGGHRGLESIAACLGTTEFSRLRVGIGRPTVGDASDYVLSVFSEKDEAVVMKALEEASQALKIWVFEGIEACMNAFN
ncbi:MAG: aminoacyl-tRNA hydrolase [Planctomycetota bacterium]|nr:aminoacyl-tRNA hydrolase [Planctomycetota bacterium]